MNKKQWVTENPLTTVGARRLLKLATFLRSMPRAKFNFTTIMSIGDKPPMEALKAGEHRCGTAGCAIGWMPAVWPRLLSWEGDDAVILNDTDNIDFQAASEFFGISENDTLHLFNPNDNSEDASGVYRYNNLGFRATPKVVARHIRKFVKHNYHGAATLD